MIEWAIAGVIGGAITALMILVILTLFTIFALVVSESEGLGPRFARIAMGFVLVGFLVYITWQITALVHGALWR